MEELQETKGLYAQKSAKIIRDSIKSAVFIDENALEPFERKSEKDEKEEDLCIQLHGNFKDNGVSLAIHKFHKKDVLDEKTKNYLFDGRDLVLLDWKLDGNSGEDYALQLLSEIIEKPHIHFCCLYTSEKDLDNVFHNVLSYFSGENDAYYTHVKESLSDEEEEIKKLHSQLKAISVNRGVAGKRIGRISAEHRDLLKKIKEATGERATECALIKVGIAFDNTFKSKNPLPCPEVVSFDQKVIVIENTIVVILKKHYENDPKKLISRIANQVILSKKSFTQLLGLEMQNIFDRTGSFIDSKLLEVSQDALLKHRSQLHSEGLKLPFKHFIKEVLFVQANLKVAGEDLELLEDEVLDELYDSEAKVKTEELISMNVFYNAIHIPSENRINFGCVFKREELEEYYMCITPKSDCLRPKDKIRNSFQFVKGVPIQPQKALSLGDTAFISFLKRNKVVSWTEHDGTVANPEMHKYKPIYAKPIAYTVPSPKFGEEKKIELIRLDEKGKVESFSATYVTTIKPNYCQRIANHAFNHPVRVSVDFVKERKK